MSTQSKIEANRANAQKSTGPRTAEGKAKSSRNSTVHAFTSESPLLPDEDPADLQALCDAYFADLRPDGQAEEDLVERIAVAQYRLRRVPLLEAGYFDLRLRMRPLPECHNQDGKAKLMSWAYQTDCGAHNTLDKLGRYEGRFQREITRWFNENLQRDVAVTARLEGLNLARAWPPCRRWSTDWVWNTGVHGALPGGDPRRTLLSGRPCAGQIGSLNA